MSEIDKLLQELQALKNNVEARRDSEKSDEDYLEKLREKLDTLLNTPDQFEFGDIVKWKKGLKNRKYPKEEQLCIVVEVLDTPKIGERDSGSPYFGEPLDLILALLDDDKKDLLLFHYDKRRFEVFRKAKNLN